MKDSTWNMLCIAAVVAVVGVVGYLSHKSNIRVKAEHAAWVADAQAKGCIRTGFVGRHAIPIWTCRDGQVYLEYHQ